MRVPNIERTPDFMQAVGMLLVGVVIGCILMMIIEHNNFQTVLEENIDLRSERDKLQQNVASLEKLKNRRYVIKKTNVIFEGKALEKNIQSELEARILKDLEAAVGNPANIDPGVYRSMVDGHEYRDINGTNYRIRVTMLSVNQTELSVFVLAEAVVSN
ncbi:hypothetical protein [Paenibacillus alkalitolerans]|uniref:hypothetical protein n=1 Tax=Paenibacillus alkalitolerans TaxID=2799335 RepID=UPI0018F557C2|nr:hypothetical protein [Paenibacillus alkalitolerans]